MRQQTIKLPTILTTLAKSLKNKALNVVSMLAVNLPQHLPQHTTFGMWQVLTTPNKQYNSNLQPCGKW